MRLPSPDVEAANATILRDKALNLRESVNSSRARMSAQRERLERLRVEIAELRALVEKPLPVRAAAPAPFLKEAVPDSAPKTTGRAWKHLPYALIFVAAIGLQVHAVPGRALAAPALPVAAVATLPPASPEAVAEDDGADEALMLAHDWRLPGDERPLAERLGSGTNPPGSQPEWTAERTGERIYRVSFRPARADVSYDFDVDLTAHSVDPTPETAELIAPRLAASR